MNDQHGQAPSYAKGLTDGTKVPGTYRRFIEKFPELGEAHESIGQAVGKVGPLDLKTQSMIKMGICIGAGLESAFRSHVRRALQHGATVEELEQTLLLSMTTVGFPRTVMAWQWLWQQIERNQCETEGTA